MEEMSLTFWPNRRIFLGGLRRSFQPSSKLGLRYSALVVADHYWGGFLLIEIKAGMGLRLSKTIFDRESKGRDWDMNLEMT